jgi:hypothetical protein
MGWIRAHWRLLTTGVVGLLVGAGIGASGKKTTTTNTVTTTATVFHTRPRTAKAGKTRIIVKTHTVTDRVTDTVTASATPTAAAAAPAPTGGGQHFSGTGTQNIGTVNVSQQSTLRWSCPSCASSNFQIFNSANDGSPIPVNGLNQTGGQTVIDAGAYHDVTVNTEGQGWTITINPG